MNFTFSRAEGPKSQCHHTQAPWSTLLSYFFTSIKQEAGWDGCAAPNEGTLPSAHFRHGKQRAMVEGFPPRQCDPGPVKEFPQPIEGLPCVSQRISEWRQGSDHCVSPSLLCSKREYFLALSYPYSTLVHQLSMFLYLQMKNRCLWLDGVYAREPPYFLQDMGLMAPRGCPLERGECVLSLRRKESLWGD